MTKIAVAYICNNLDYQDNYIQCKLITKFAKEREYQIEQWFEDNVEWENRMSPDRKALGELMAWIKNNKDKTIIMVGVGRMTLDFDKFIEINKILNENNILPAFIECELTLNEKERELMETIEKVMAIGEGEISNFKQTNE